MTRMQTKAKCRLCQREMSKGGMSCHLQLCIETYEHATNKRSKQETLYLLRVEGRENPIYWMHLELSATTTFGTLDRFLKQIWLECCGHMSAFDFGSHFVPEKASKSMDYDDFWGENNSDMELLLGEVLFPKMKFHYTYDFGSSTSLTLQVVGVREGIAHKHPIMLLARNEPPPIVCDYCKKKPAIELCPVCAWDGKAWVCKGCKKKHKCGEGAWLPVVNSPRVGVCAYSDPGEEDFEESSEEDAEKLLEDAEKLLEEKISELQGNHKEVVDLIEEQMKSRYDKEAYLLGMALWTDFASRTNPRIRAIGSYAGATEYLVTQTGRGKPVTQKELAKRYKTTASSISQNFYKIAETLGLFEEDEDEDDDTIEFADGSEEETQAVFGMLSHMMSGKNLEDAPENVQKMMSEVLEQIGLSIQEPDDIALVLTAEQKDILKNLPMVKETWIGGTHTMPFYVSEPVPMQPELCLWVNSTGHPIVGQSMDLTSNDPQLLLDLLINSMQRSKMCEPGRRKKLLIVQADYVEPFQQLLAPFGIEVKCGGEKIIESICTLMKADLSEQEKPSSYLQNGQVHQEILKLFFEACSALHENPPWEILGDSQPFLVDLTAWGLAKYRLSIMGAAGLEQGMLIFDSLGDFERFRQMCIAADDMSVRPDDLEVSFHALNFDSFGDVSKEQRREVMEHGWRMASTDAYPDLKHINPDMSIVPLQEEDFVIATACAWAVAEYTKKNAKHMHKVDEGMNNNRNVRSKTMTLKIPMFPERSKVKVSLPDPLRVQRTKSLLK